MIIFFQIPPISTISPFFQQTPGHWKKKTPDMIPNDFDDCLAIPPMDPTFLSDLNDDVYLNDFDFDLDFSIDDLLNDPQLVNAPSPESNCASNILLNTVTSSPISDNNNNNNLDDHVNENSKKNGLLKRKKETEDSTNSNKQRKSSDASSNDVDSKTKARLIRNRESAHLSRQRKKDYVQGLENKVKAMVSTVQELNAKLSYITAENISLKQQISGGTTPPSTMYMAPPMMYPWMPVPVPPYMVKTQGWKVPLLPMKCQPMESAPRVSKKSGGRTKKVASVSFLGLLFFMLLFGGLVPMVNVRYRGMKDSSDFVGNGHRGRVLTVNGSGYDESFSKGPDVNSKFSCVPGQLSGGQPRAKHCGYEFVGEGNGNGSEPLMASLYVPRNDKLVKIDGNLIIHSILASEEATTRGADQKERTDVETGLAIPGDLVPSDPRRNTRRHPHLALGSGGENVNLKATVADPKLHQWFREGLAGPMLSSGKCTEVFQFDVVPASAPGTIISATSARNVSTASSKNSTKISKGRNRRILHGLPIPLPSSSAQNISHEGTGRDAGNGIFPGTNSSSSMVVSVLLDPREAADAEVDGVMRVKSLSKIFVVVLIDGVKYVTYSCMFPFKGAAVPHLVTA